MVSSIGESRCVLAIRATGVGLGEIYFLPILQLVLARGNTAYSNFQVHPLFNFFFFFHYLSSFAVHVQVSVTMVTA